MTHPRAEARRQATAATELIPVIRDQTQLLPIVEDRAVAWTGTSGPAGSRSHVDAARGGLAADHPVAAVGTGGGVEQRWPGYDWGAVDADLLPRRPRPRPALPDPYRPDGVYLSRHAAD